MAPLSGSADVTLRSLLIDGAGAATSAVVGNGGSLVLRGGYAVRSVLPHPRIEVRLEREVGSSGWAATGTAAAISPGDPLTIRTPPYSTSAATEVLHYRFASATSVSEPISIVVENQQFYSGMAATVYRYAAPYCPSTAVHIADLTGREAGDYRTGALLIRVAPDVGVRVNLDGASQRALAIHECSHELQWLNYGGTPDGFARMKTSAAEYFSEGSNGAAPLEHAANCGAKAVNPAGYLGYGGYCTQGELVEGMRLLTGQRY